MVRSFFTLFLIIQFINYCRCYEVVHPLNPEKSLITHLLQNYQVQYGRPVKNMTETVVVYFEVCLIQLIDLDERNQVLVTNVQNQYVWKDNGLIWDPSKFGGLSYITLPVAQIWTPDIVLYNYADTRLEEKREVLVVVSSDGKVKWRPPSIFKSTCQINIELFPYDQQNCSMKFGSWTYDGDSIDIQFLGNPEMNTDLYMVSNEWDIVSTKAKRNIVNYACCKEFFPDITYYLTMNRKGGFYNYILVLPCFLLTCLTVVLFWLPPESPAKMVLGMSIFTSFFVLLLLLSKNVPSATDKIPLIGAYYCLNMVMIATSTCLCTVVVHIYFRGQGEVPTLIRKLFLEILARLFCMIRPPVLPPVLPKKPPTFVVEQPAALITSVNSRGNLSHHVNRKSSVLTTNTQHRQSTSMSVLNQSELNPNSPNLEQSHNSQLKRNSTQMQAQQSSANVIQHQLSKQINSGFQLSFDLIENDIKEIRDYLRHTRKKMETSDSKTKQTNDWKQVALVMDRALFYLYIIANIVSGCLMFNK